MITFNISNIISEENKILVFYKFNNGVEYSNRFEKDTILNNIIEWGNIEAEKFNNTVEIEDKINELKEVLNDSNN